MFAIFSSGAKQYKVSENETFYAEKLPGNVGDKVIFHQILMVNGHFGKPYVKDAKVICEILKQGKQPKLTIIKHISQKHHTKKQGHRQPYTKLIVKEIKFGN